MSRWNGLIGLVLLGALVYGLLTPESSSAAFLSFVEKQQDGVGGVDGLNSAFGVDVSPDGKHVYAAATADNAVSIFSRDAATGALTFVGIIKDGVNGVDGLAGAYAVTVSPDGAHVYAAGLGDNAVAVFSRDAATGALAFVEAQRDGVGGVDGLASIGSVNVSPDGNHVYTAAMNGGLAVFSRNTTTGALTFVEVQRNGVGGVDGMQQTSYVTTSPDGQHVYATGVGGNGGVAVFGRNITTGQLTFVEAQKSSARFELSGARSVTTSPDGKQVYVAADFASAVSVFGRDATTGKLSFVEAEKDGFNGVDGLFAAFSVKVSPDGQHLYVTGQFESALAVFNRDLTTGQIAFIEAQKNGVGGVSGLDNVETVAVSPDSAHIYTVSQLDDALAVFKAGAATPPTATSTSTSTATTLRQLLPAVANPPTATPIPTATATPTASPTPSRTPTASATPVPGARLRLDVCQDGDSDFLSPNCPARSGITQYYFYPPNNSREFEHTLTGDIQGNSYGFTVWLGSGGTTTFNVSIILRKDGADTVLASTPFTSATRTYTQFSTTVTGVDPATASGDKLILRVTAVSGSDAGMVDGPVQQCFITIPSVR
jgi:6-phosphogluconolactonase (cycloisomerase 2 family)